MKEYLKIKKALLIMMMSTSALGISGCTTEVINEALIDATDEPNVFKYYFVIIENGNALIYEAKYYSITDGFISYTLTNDEKVKFPIDKVAEFKSFDEATNYANAIIKDDGQITLMSELENSETQVRILENN